MSEREMNVVVQGAIRWHEYCEVVAQSPDAQNYTFNKPESKCIELLVLLIQLRLLEQLSKSLADHIKTSKPDYCKLKKITVLLGRQFDRARVPLLVE